MRHIVLLGFGAVVALMILLGALVLRQIHTAKGSITTIVEVNNTKVELANTMRESIRLRQISMNSMLTIDDPFQLDEELIKFYQYARPYRIAREQLVALPTDERENDIHARLTQQVRIAQPLNQEAATLLTENRPLRETKAVVEHAQREQGKLLALLDELVELQRQYAHEAVIRGQRKSEETVFLVITFGTILTAGTLGIGVFVARVVARKNKELVQAAEETRSKSAFLANMSHEIRTPLTAIIGFAETSLYSNQSAQERHRAMATIIRSGRHLLHIINDILDLSKIEANELELERVPLSPFHLLAEIEPFVRPKAAEKGVMFGVNYLFPLPEIILSDPLRLKQILLNLCSNAVKFTDTGHIHINVSIDNRAERMSFEVVDSGIGMDAEQIEKVFEPFKQADSSTTRKYGGTGLGLSLSTQLAQALGGSLSVQSEPGHGSRFKLTVATGSRDDLCLVYNEKHIPAQEPTTVESLPDATLTGTTLLVEDNPDNQQLLSMLLRRLGVEVTLAENGRVAVEKANAEVFDLVLMDMQMPEMDGMEAVRILRAQGYKKPIVALTANAMKEDRERCLAAGCNDFLTKPVERDRFYEVVSSYMDSRDRDEFESMPITPVLLEEDSEFINLVHKFINALPATMTQIEEAMREENWEQLKPPVHQLKGNGGSFGYDVLSDLAASMELQVLNKNPEELSALLKEMKRVYKRIVAGLETADYADGNGTKSACA